jgi:hypothetical protein
LSNTQAPHKVATKKMKKASTSFSPESPATSLPQLPIGHHESISRHRHRSRTPIQSESSLVGRNHTPIRSESRKRQRSPSPIGSQSSHHGNSHNPVRPETKKRHRVAAQSAINQLIVIEVILLVFALNQGILEEMIAVVLNQVIVVEELGLEVILFQFIQRSSFEKHKHPSFLKIE